MSNKHIPHIEGGYEVRVLEIPHVSAYRLRSVDPEYLKYHRDYCESHIRYVARENPAVTPVYDFYIGDDDFGFYQHNLLPTVQHQLED